MGNEREGAAAVDTALRGGSTPPYLRSGASASNSQPSASPSSAPDRRHDSASSPVVTKYHRAHWSNVNNANFGANQFALQGGAQSSQGPPPIIPAGPSAIDHHWREGPSYWRNHNLANPQVRLPDLSKPGTHPSWTMNVPDFGLAAAGSGGDDGDKGRQSQQPKTPVGPGLPDLRKYFNYARFLANRSGAIQPGVEDTERFPRPEKTDRYYMSDARDADIAEYDARVKAGQYAMTFSNRLAEDIVKIPSSESLHNCSEHLPGWFELFSYKLLREAETAPERGAAVLIHTYQANIIENVCELLRDSESKIDSQGPETNSDIRVDENSEVDHSIGGQEETRFRDLTVYTQFIPGSAAYEWLLSKIERCITLEIKGASRMASIGHMIRSRLLAQPASHTPDHPFFLESMDVSFTLEWNPFTFWKNQGYESTVEDCFNHILCLTGTWKHAQAVTVAEYMEQTWPLTCRPLLALLRQLSSTPKPSCSVTNTRDAVITFHERDRDSCVVRVQGGIDFATEVGEQLAWLAATLRSSPVNNGVLTCLPTIRYFHVPDTDLRRRGLVKAVCKLDFEISMAEDIASNTRGFCWAGLFRNPLLVTNYPIRRRTEGDTGLEMSLAIMSQFIGSKQLTKTGERFLLKGFCSLLVATAVKDDTVMWHLFYNPNGDRISYCDPRLDNIKSEIPEGLLLTDLQTRRHVVGWCSNICEVTGQPEARYDIRASDLPEPADCIVLDTAYVEAGGPVVGGIKASIGKRELPVRLTRGSTLLALLDWVCDLPVVFHDVGDQRAWLVDGASALLHLVMASIKRDQDREAYGSRWQFYRLLEAGSAIDILRNQANLDAILYHDSQAAPAPYTFRDRVREVLHHLELLVDHQVLAGKRDGYWFPKTPSAVLKHTVGWDFWEVLKHHSVISNRTHCLDVWGRGWVDYIRHTGAMVIFGQGFGEMIRPENPEGLCPDWRTVRTGTELLCSSIKTLKKIQKAKSPASLLPGELATDIIWSSRCELFEPCQCLALEPPGEFEHVDPVQVLLLKNKIGELDTSGIRSRITLSELDDNGAVVFGHTPHIKTFPKLPKLNWSSDGDRGQGRGSGSSGGLTTEQTAIGDGSVRDLQCPASAEPTSATGLGGPPTENFALGDSPTKRRKRPSWIRSLFCNVPLASRKRRGGNN